VISGVHSEVGRSSPSRGERVKGMMTSGMARCRHMGRAAEDTSRGRDRMRKKP
jgi:hypothetical protein